MNEQANNALSQAVHLAEHGFYLTPVTVTRKPDGKKAARFHRPSWKTEGDVSRDPEVIRAWWVDHPDTSFALVCGPSGVEGVDLDVKPDQNIDAVSWWGTRNHPAGPFIVETPSGGQHHIWRRRPGGRTLPNRAGQLIAGVDTRNHDGVFFAAGGYVLGDVGGYRIQGPLHRADELPYTPDEVLDLFPHDVPKNRRADGSITTHDNGWMLDRLAEQLDRVRTHNRSAGGFRHLLNGAAMVAGRLVEAGLTEQAAAVHVLREAVTACWGHVDSEDEQWLQDGLRDGPAMERWREKATSQQDHGRETHGQNGQNHRQQTGEPGSGHFGHASGDPWNEQPVPLGWQPQPLPTDALGPVLGPLADAIAESYQAPADLAVNLALPLITTTAGGRWTVQVTADWSETVALATLSALASGERKSPVLRLLAEPLIQHERDALAAAQPVIARQQAELRIAEDRAEQLRKDAVKSGTTTDSEMYVNACQDLAEMPVNPVPRWLVDDITPEAIAQRLAEHGSIGAVSAEPGLFSILAGRYSNGAPNVENVLKATSGDPITVDRMGRDPIHVDSPALSISMCIQPGRLTELGGPGKVFRGSGLLARLLYVLPEPRVGTRSISSKPVPADVSNAWTEHLGKLLAATITTPGVITVAPGALVQLDAFRTALEPRLHPNHGALAGIADWGSKLPGTVVRIAAALTLLADPYRTSIDETTMANAIRLGEAYTSHAQAAFATIHAADDNLANARGVLDWLRKNTQQTFTLRDVYRALRGRAWIEKADDLRPVLAVLVEHGHIRALTDDRSHGEAGRPSERYELHPSHAHQEDKP